MSGLKNKPLRKKLVDKEKISDKIILSSMRELVGTMNNGITVFKMALSKTEKSFLDYSG